MVHTVVGWIDNGEEPDWDEPERRTHCTCGAFLPKKPTFEGDVRMEWRDYGYENLETGEWVTDMVLEAVEYEPFHRLPPVREGADGSRTVAVTPFARWRIRRCKQITGW
jgi:hypothetical protein